MVAGASISLCAGAQVTNVTCVWDANPVAQQVTGYRLWETNAGVVRLVAFSLTNGVVFTNYDLSQPHTLAVTATNALGDSLRTNWTVFPPAPTQPLNLKPVPLTLNTPLPTVIEFSTDLADWTERLYIRTNNTGVTVTLWTRPTEPVMFARTRDPAQPASASRLMRPR